MNNINTKNKLLKIVAGAAALSLVLYFGFLFLVQKEIKKVENAYTNSNPDSFSEEQFWQVKSIVEKNEAEVQSLRDFFIQKGDEVKFIEKIEGLARASGINFEIDSIEAKNGQKDSVKEDVYVKMKIEGSWRGITYFIDKLRKMPFGVSIDNINLDANGKGVWSGDLLFVIFREI